MSWHNLFYAAPLGAPAALSLAGVLGLLAERVRDTRAGDRRRCSAAGRTLLAALAGARPARHPARRRCCISAAPITIRRCVLPVTVPPVAAALLARRRARCRKRGDAADALVAAAAPRCWALGLGVPCLWRPAQHGRLAQLDPESAERAAAAGAAQLSPALALAGLAALDLLEDEPPMSDRYPGYDVLAKRHTPRGTSRPGA